MINVTTQTNLQPIKYFVLLFTSRSRRTRDTTGQHCIASCPMLGRVVQGPEGWFYSCCHRTKHRRTHWPSATTPILLSARESEAVVADGFADSLPTSIVGSIFDCHSHVHLYDVPFTVNSLRGMFGRLYRRLVVHVL